MPVPNTVGVTEVVLRDGLQDEDVIVPTEAKTALFEDLVRAGVRSIELGAFVRPDRVPTMADTDELFARLRGRAGVTCSGLVMNLAGARRALAAGAAEVRLVVSASEGHSRANAGRGRDEALEEVVQASTALAGSADAPVISAGIATAFVCPYDGPTPPKRLADMATRLAGAGATSISLADTLGAADPLQVRAGISAVREALPGVQLGLHLHDTHGRALACAWEALQHGVDWFDSSLGGVGGCPFAPGAAGNVATEDLVAMLHAVGCETGIDLPRLLDVLPVLEQLLGHPLDSRQWRLRNSGAGSPGGG
ncbi:MAG: hydroxymethylglutaryl-CoA lyase [Marmoricola sp.]